MKAKDLVLTALFSTLMIAGAMVKVYAPFLPFSLQPFFCALAGLILGKRLGGLSQIVYISLGLFGLPVFTQGGGFGYIFNPSFGYLIGFVFAAYSIGLIFEITKKIKTSYRYILSLLGGLIVIYVFGIPYMYLILKVYIQNSDISLLAIISSNILYIIKDAITFVFAGLLAIKLKPIISK